MGYHPGYDLWDSLGKHTSHENSRAPSLYSALIYFVSALKGPSTLID